MTGLEKITGKILADARSDAQKTVAEAERECLATADKYRRAADAVREEQEAAARKECEALIVRAKSASAMQKRNIMLRFRAEMIDSAYAEAYRQLTHLPDGAYEALLTKLLTEALVGVVTSEQHNLAVYGEEEESVEKDADFEVLLNARDREKFGAKILEGVRRAVVGKLDASVLERLKLSDATVRADGGVILRHGEIESNCTLEMVFATHREKTEGEVGKILFD